MTLQRKWTKEEIEAYLALHPNTGLKELGRGLGVSKQRMHQILRSFDIKLSGKTEKAPIRKGSSLSQRVHIRKEPVTEAVKSKAIASHPQSRARLILVSPCSNDQIIEAIKSGATAYLARDIAMEEVRQGAYARDFLPADPLKGRQYKLTKRELEVLQHVASGKSHSDTGKALGITGQTVKNHMTLIMRKLGANNRAHAAVLALQYGILSLDEIAPRQQSS